ncbi:MAG TPA: ABC transporter permease [Acidisoma sp.]|uniref:ABC transporter permease n=1 Tax=Acidisoma sp. TaxID=1872115 RepID=UPI002BFA6FBB|nr:ABC transporter permease [Acidisoma sp.]HTI03290.1 ABC transporter permease [Acidisoma sp.]
MLRAYVAKRLIATIPVLLGVSVVIFLLMHLAPGDVTTVLLGPQATEQDRMVLRHALGLDLPLPIQYGRWLLRIISGDFGTSIATSLPVLQLILPRFVNTIILTVGSLFLAITAGYGLGFLCALRARSLLDRIVMTVTLVLGSTPPFWLGLVLVLFFALHLHWLPVSGMIDMAGDGGVIDTLYHLILPAVTTALAPAAIIARMVRSSILDSLARPHVRVARAKGLRQRDLLRRHVILDALPPITTITGLQLGYLLGGALFSEVVFAWPGLGSLLYDSITARDMPVVQAATLLIALSFVIVNILVDFMNVLIDPRLRER